MSKSKNKVKEPEVETPEEKKSEEIIEVSWEDLQEVFLVRERLNSVESYFASMCLQFEKNKISLVSEISNLEKDMYQMANLLKDSKKIDSSFAYELKLPATSGEKGYFIRKD